MANEQIIRDGHGKVKRNIHLIVGIVFAVIIGLVFFYEETKSQQAKKEEKAAQNKPKVDVANAPEPKTLEQIIKKQKNSTPEFPGQVGPGVPGIATEGLKDKDGSSISKEEEDRRIEEAKRQSQLAASGIIALGGDFLPVQSAEQDQKAAAPATIADILAGADTSKSAPITLPTDSESKSTAPQTKQESDIAWQNQQQNLKKVNVVLEDGENSPYTIFQGTYIPAIMMTAITSQLPGNVTAMVSRNVYDGVTGRHLIIPKGSKLYGEINNNVADGQTRLMVAFSRIIMPGGRSITLPGMLSTDAAGAAGIPGDVNNHYMQRFGVGTLAALVGYIVDRQSNSGSSTTVINTGSGSGSPTSAAGSIVVDMARQNQQRVNAIPAEITVKQGNPFNIIVNQDIAIRPYD